MADEEKDLPASGKRRQKLREEGTVIKSQDVSTTAVLAAGLFGLLAFGAHLAQGLGNVMTACFREMEKKSSFSEATAPLVVIFDRELFLFLGIFLFLAALVSFGAQFLQVGPLFTTYPLQIRPDKLNPVNGFKRLFSLRKLVQVLISIVKLVVILAFIFSAVKALFITPVFIRPVNVQELGRFMVSVAWEIGWRVLLALACISIIDYLYQRWQYEKDHRMSRHEYKDEFKQTEGSPEVKSKRKRLMFQKTLRRMLEDMTDATIVVNNPTHYSVALRYVRGVTPAPVVIAKGIRLIALRIRKRAEELNIPMVENKALAQGLYKHANIGDLIPVVFYHAVATILAELQRRGIGDAAQETEEPLEEESTEDESQNEPLNE